MPTRKTRAASSRSATLRPIPKPIERERSRNLRAMDAFEEGVYVNTRQLRRYRAFKAIDSEREFQEALIAQASSSPDKPIEAYALYITDYVRELNTQLTRNWGPGVAEAKALPTLRKIAALAVACMEQHGAPIRQFELATILNTVNGAIRR